MQYYSECPNCGERKEFPDGKPYVCAKCIQVVNDRMSPISTNIEALKPFKGAERNSFIIGLLVFVPLAIFLKHQGDVPVSQTKAFMVGITFPPLLLAELIIMFRYGVYTYYSSIVYRTKRPTLFGFIRLLIFSGLIFVIVFLTGPHLINYM